MALSVGTFNLNNLFSRFNYAGSIGQLPPPKPSDEPAIVEEVRLEPPQAGEPQDWVRTFKGRLVKAKNPRDTQRVADRIAAMDVDVLCVQEVEDERALADFNKRFLGDRYPELIVIDGNDPRLIDVGVLSKLPLGAVTTWQHVTHPEVEGKVFGRDLLEVQVLDASGDTRLTVFNTHLKSHFVDPWNSKEKRPRTPAEIEEEHRKANDLRHHQADAIAAIVGDRERAVLAGDLNDPPLSQHLDPLPTIGLVDALTAPTETRPAPDDPGDPAPASPAWTHRFKASGQPAHYELFDHLWLTPDLQAAQTSAHIDRRTRLGGDGSDHDPAWIVLDI